MNLLGHLENPVARRELAYQRRTADLSSMTAAGPAVAAADADAASSTTAEVVTREAAAIACSLENPEHCEACQ